MGQSEHRDRGPDALRVRATIERLVSDGTAVARSDSTLHGLFPVAVSAAEGEAVRGWVAREGATRTVEVGLGYGVSALQVCEGLLANVDTAGRHVAVDPFQATGFSGCGLRFLEEAGVAGMMKHRAQRSETALPCLLGEGRSFDLAFVDGDPRFDGVFVDLFYLGRLVRPGGGVFLDDHQLPAVGRAASFFLKILKILGWSVEEVSAWDDLHRWAVLRTSTAPDRRPFDVYVDIFRRGARESVAPDLRQTPVEEALLRSRRGVCNLPYGSSSHASPSPSGSRT